MLPLGGGGARAEFALSDMDQTRRHIQNAQSARQAKHVSVHRLRRRGNACRSETQAGDLAKAFVAYVTTNQKDSAIGSGPQFAKRVSIPGDVVMT
jgi:hypothetical protein